MRVFVLLFNARTDDEGIHTIRVNDRNKVLMFESSDDAERFAMLLEAQDFPVPSVEPMDSQEIEEFCSSADYDWEIVPSNGALAIPPELNVEETDWNPNAEKVSNNTDAPNQQKSDMGDIPDSELDSIRRRLEGLI
ncbi:hypothetical protein NIES4071_21090 [Calothrix sp. NIES-4071]|nr:hypothetical protein NIES4071_21090 [Calothrix sp. NIES-4071]BAZ56441.1 hypothetical protein NIES4105_21040 [Calothrix sp. NIES-4105]